MKEPILLVDDDEEICEEMSEILTHEGYLVSTAFDGEEALKMIDSHPFKLVIMDIKMPKINGFDALKRIKNDFPSMKVLLVSGRPFIKHFLPGEESARKEKNSKVLDMADGFINKPFDIPLVLKTIHSLVYVE